MAKLTTGLFSAEREAENQGSCATPCLVTRSETSSPRHLIVSATISKEPLHGKVMISSNLNDFF